MADEDDGRTIANLVVAILGRLPRNRIYFLPKESPFEVGENNATTLFQPDGSPSLHLFFGLPLDLFYQALEKTNLLKVTKRKSREGEWGSAAWKKDNVDWQIFLDARDMNSTKTGSRISSYTSVTERYVSKNKRFVMLMTGDKEGLIAWNQENLKQSIFDGSIVCPQSREDAAKIERILQSSTKDATSNVTTPQRTDTSGTSNTASGAVPAARVSLSPTIAPSLANDAIVVKRNLDEAFRAWWNLPEQVAIRKQRRNGVAKFAVKLNNNKEIHMVKAPSSTSTNWNNISSTNC
jgi:hypothetical protein